ncbi:MAG: LysE family translocator [Nanoarchaeales archaeon]|nr:LysE family translocator [Nanoarchaeales archaeon]
MGFLESILIGFSISAIPGPIFFEIVRRVLTKNFWSGISISIGDFIGNFLILLLIFFGVSTFLTSQTAQSILFITGSCILIWLGITALRLKKEEIDNSYKNKISNKNSILIGLGISISSPIVIAFWISLSGSYLVQFTSKNVAFLNIFYITLGFVLFHLILALIIHFTKHKISSKNIIKFSKVFGIILILYGIKFFYNLIKIII